MEARQNGSVTTIELTQGEARSLLALVRLSLANLSKLRESGYTLRNERSQTGAAAKLAHALQNELEIATGERLRRAGTRRKVIKPHGLE